MFTPSFSRAFLLGHALVALALAGASTHLALVVLGIQRAQRIYAAKVRLTRIYSQVAGWLFTATVVMGALVYPAYRYQVRGLYLDRYANWASNLFDFKETLAALGLPFAVGLVLLGPRFKGDDRDVQTVLTACALVVFGIVAFNVVSGLIIVTVRSV